MRKPRKRKRLIIVQEKCKIMDKKEKSLVIHPDISQFIISHMLVCMPIPMLLSYYGFGEGYIRYAIILGLVVISLYMLFSYLYLRNLTYKIDGERLMIQRGVFSIDRDFIELYRVVDYEERSTFLQRVFGIKNVSIYSGDRTMPKLEMVGITSDLDIIYIIRKQVEKCKKERGVYEITNRM